MEKNEEILENPFIADDEPKPKAQKPKRKKVIFAITEPTEENKCPPVLAYLDTKENIVLLHNRFNYANEEGQKTLALLKGKDLPDSGHLFEKMMRQEFWGIKQSNLVLFDLDTVNTFHLMSVAAAFNKPIVCVSETLKPVPPYFSGSVLGVFKVSDLDMFLTSFKKPKAKKPETSKPVVHTEAGPVELEKPLSPTATKIQGILHKALVDQNKRNTAPNE